MSTAELNRHKWLQDRLRGIGASEWATVLGIDPRKSRFELACEKLGEIPPVDYSDREDIEFGHLFEPVALQVLAKRTGRQVEPWPQDKIVVSPTHDFIFATPDALQVDQQKGEGVAETKNRCEWMAREWQTEPPLLVQVQIQAQMFATGRTWGSICVILGGNRFRHFDVDRDDVFIEAALPALEEFWALVQAGRKPDPVATAACAKAIARLHPDDNGQEIELPRAFDGSYSELTALKACIKTLETRKTEIENRVKLALGDNTFGLLPSGNSFSWKTQGRVTTCPHCSEVISDSTFRVLRQHKPKKGYGHRDMHSDCQEAIAQATAALLAHGATLRHESDAGSRYFLLAGDFEIRLSDHEPNEKTDAWMGRKSVASIRVDQPDWRDQLEAVTGPLMIEN